MISRHLDSFPVGLNQAFSLPPLSDPEKDRGHVFEKIGGDVGDATGVLDWDQDFFDPVSRNFETKTDSGL